MSTENRKNDFLDQFRTISTKLKKRFLRKPNVTEACDAFSTLGMQCEMNELLSYAGLCWIAAARCEGSLGNAPSEVNCLLRAARQFVKAEYRDKTLGCPSPANEHLQASLNCYTYASSRCPDNSPLTVGLNVEMADVLKNKFGLNETAEQYLRLATAYSGHCLDTKLHCLGLLASTFVESGDHTSALLVFLEMSSLLDSGLLLTGTQTDLLLRCEFSQVFLLLILRPAAQRLATPLVKLLDKYMWGNASDMSVRVHGMSAHLFLLMQSLVMACQSLDTVTLAEVEAELWPQLSTELRGLLRTLVRQYIV